MCGPVKPLSIHFEVFWFGREPGLFLNIHIAELVGVENLSAVLAFYVFGVILARHDAHSGVFAGRWHGVGGPIKKARYAESAASGRRLSSYFRANRLNCNGPCRNGNNAPFWAGLIAIIEKREAAIVYRPPRLLY